MLTGTFYILFLTGLVASTAVNNSVDEENIDRHGLSKRGRFISFNNEEGEIKMELDFSVPFMKIPVSTKRSGEVVHPTLDINARGLVTVGAMLVLFVTVIPKIVKLFVPHAEATATDSLLPLMGRVEEALQSMDISSTECYQRSSCWLASKASINYPFESTKSSEWIGSIIESDAIQDAIKRGMNGEDCSTYKCPLSMNSLSQMLKIGRSVLM